MVILGLFIGLATVYSALLPLGEAADETDHFALVRFIAEHGRPPLTVAERHAIGPKGDASPIYHGLVALLTQHVDTTALPRLPDTQASPKRLIPTDGFRANRVFHTEDELFPWRGAVLAWHLARLVSVPLGATVVVAAYLTGLSLFPHRRSLAVAAAACVAFLPRFLIHSAVVNDDALVVPLAAFAVYMMVRIAQGAHHPRAFLLLGLLMGLAAITKYHSLVLLPEATLLCIVLAWRDAVRSPSWRHVWLAWLRRWAWMMLAFLLTAGWWFAFLLVRFNQVAELGWVRGLIAPLGDPVLTTGLSHLFETPAGAASAQAFGWGDWANLLFRSFWLTYGWLHVFAPAWVYTTLGVWALLATVGLLGQLIKHGRASGREANGHTRLSHPSTWRWDIIILVLHVLIYLGIMVMRQTSRPARETAQGRHLYPALTALACLLVYGLSGLPHVARDMANSVRRWCLDRSGTLASTGETRDRAWSALCAFSLPTALLALSLVALPAIILPVYLPYLPVRTINPKEAAIGHRLKASFAPGLKLVGYDLPSSSESPSGSQIPSFEAGAGIPVTLYWYASAPQTRDYLVHLCLQNAQEEKVLCTYAHPLDGRYPVRAWETGYLIRDAMILPTSPCLPESIYTLSLEMLPVQPESAATLIDARLPHPEPVVLSRLSLKPPAQAIATRPRIAVWTAQGALQQETLDVHQLRQGFTVFVQQPAGASAPGEQPSVWLASRQEPARRWQPVALHSVCRGPEGQALIAYSFIADAAVQPGEYMLQTASEVDTGLLVRVATRWRNFEPLASLTTSPEATIVGCGEETVEPCMELVGYELERSARWPGESITITAHWRSRRTMSQPYTIALYLLDNLARVGGRLEWSLGGHYPNVLWAPGEYVSETYQLPVYLDALPGLHTIQLGLYAYQTDERDSTLTWLPLTNTSLQTPTDRLYLGQVRVRDVAEDGMPSHPLRVTLGDQIQLLGYDLWPAADRTLAPGGILHLTLYWQAIRPPRDDYTVFTQLLGPDGLVWGQQDNQPQGGRYPTSQWEVGQQIVDRYVISLRSDAPPGTYRLLVGMYHLASGQRLSAVATDGTPLADDAIPVVRLRVK